MRYDYNYIVRQRHGYHGCQVSNSVRPVYSNNYFKRRDRGLLVGLCVMAIVMFVAVIELGIFDGLYLWLTR